MSIREQVESKLSKVIDIQEFEWGDSSAKHAKHPEAKRSGGGHYELRVISSSFEGKSLMDRHQLIYRALAEEMGTSIHALAIKAFTVDEWRQKGNA